MRLKDKWYFKYCEECGEKIFKRYLSDLKKARFCSNMCWVTSQESRDIVKNTPHKRCFGKENHRYKHGLSIHPLHGLWRTMKGRCYNPKDTQFKYYGSRGIRVSEEWKNDAEKFIYWCLANGYKKGLTIDRIDNDGDYSSSNCRFTTYQVQARNTRRNIKYKSKTVWEWAHLLNVSPSTIYGRIRRGWPTKESIFVPVRKTVEPRVKQGGASESKKG